MPTGSDTTSTAVGELAALGKVWEEYRDRLLAMIERRIDARLRQRVGAEAVLHDTYLEAARRWPEYRRSSRMEPYPWLYCLARDRLNAEYRKHTADKRDMLREDGHLTDDCSAMIGGMVAPGTGPMTAAQRAELADRVRVVLDSLPSEVREVIVMRYFDGLSTREMCDVVNRDRPDAAPVNVGAMDVRLFRALAKMKDAWQVLYGTPEGAS